MQTFNLKLDIIGGEAIIVATNRITSKFFGYRGYCHTGWRPYYFMDAFGEEAA